LFAVVEALKEARGPKEQAGIAGLLTGPSHNDQVDLKVRKGSPVKARPQCRNTCLVL
jgi:hypothetical protein